MCSMLLPYSKRSCSSNNARYVEPTLVLIAPLEADIFFGFLSSRQSRIAHSPKSSWMSWVHRAYVGLVDYQARGLDDSLGSL
jgi:hypothetical protein